MTPGKLAVLMPTFRFDSTARHNIRTAAAMSGTDIEIFIGDNSCDPAKKQFIEDLKSNSSNVNSFHHETNIGAYANMLFLFDQQDHEFICLLSDDDFFSPDYYVAGLEELKSNSDCAVASGLIVFLTREAAGVSAWETKSNLGTTPHARIAAMVGANAAPYGVFRRRAIERFFKYLREKPFRAAYLDQFWTYNLLSQGTHVIKQDRRLYVYDNVNWNSTNAFESSARFFVEAGLTADFEHLGWLSWAVEAVHFFNSTYRPSDLDLEEAAKITRHIYGFWCLGRFREDFEQKKPMFQRLFAASPEGYRAVEDILATSHKEPERLIDRYSTILAAFNADLANRYRAFATDTLRPLPDFDFKEPTAVDSKPMSDERIVAEMPAPAPAAAGLSLFRRLTGIFNDGSKRDGSK